MVPLMNQQSSPHLNSHAGQFFLLSVSGILFVCTISFFSLTVIVDNDFIRIRFGIGLIRKSIKLADVKSCTVVRNKWWYGWGIHWTPKGLLFNISGLDAVELVMNNGKVYRIGTDKLEWDCTHYLS